MSKESNTSFGTGFTGLLAISFIVLKLCNVINWSWWWVLSPLWISAIIAILATIALIFLEVWEAKRQHKKEIERLKNSAGLPKIKSRFQQRMDEYMQNKR